MADFDSMLAAAQKLPAQELVRLIDALWGSLPDDAELPLHDDWGPEIKRPVAAIEWGTAQPIPWETVREEAPRRILPNC
jgi:putative addiction module component (TIGR02574 family)